MGEHRFPKVNGAGVIDPIQRARMQADAAQQVLRNVPMWLATFQKIVAGEFPDPNARMVLASLVGTLAVNWATGLLTSRAEWDENTRRVMTELAPLVRAWLATEDVTFTSAEPGVAIPDTERPVEPRE